jgi:hypothetical protein
MKLLDETIDALSAERPVLTDALIKTKVLLHRIGRKDLAEWVNSELNGYGEATPVPEYRVLRALIKGVVSNGAYRYSDHPLPVLHLEEKMRERYERIEMRQSISTIEELAAKDTNGLSSPIPLEFNGYFDKALSNGYQVERAWCDIGIGQLGEIKTQVRSRLLDFLLDLSERAGGDPTEEEMKRVGQSPETASMFNHAIFGDNVTILVGNQNSQRVTNAITRGDFEALSALLKAKHVPDEDIRELRTAIQADADSPEVAKKEFGPRVRNWMKSMLSKAVDASWQIELGIASNFLAEALKAYYG